MSWVEPVGRKVVQQLARRTVGLTGGLLVFLAAVTGLIFGVSPGGAQTDAEQATQVVVNISVADTEGVPIAGVSASFPEAEVVTTDETGSASFTTRGERCDLLILRPPGGVVFNAASQTLTGEPESMVVDICLFGDDPVDVSATTLPVDYTRTNAIKAEDLDGVPLAGMEVRVERNGEVVEAVTDASGQVDVEFGPGCNDVVVVHPDGWNTSSGDTEFRTQQCIRDLEFPIQTIQVVFVDPATTGSISWQVEDGNDSSTLLDGFTLKLYDEADDALSTVLAESTSSSTGLVIIDDLAINCYVAVVEAPVDFVLERGETTLSVDECVEADALQPTISIDAFDADPLINVRIDFQNAVTFGEVSGVAVEVFEVIDDEVGGLVLLIPPSDAAFGQFELGTGCYEIQTIAPDGFEFRSGNGTVSRLSERKCFDFSSSDFRTEQNLVATDFRAVVNVSLFATRGASPADAVIEFFEESEDGTGSLVAEGRTDDSGRVQLQVPLDCYRLRITLPELYLFEDGSDVFEGQECVGVFANDVDIYDIKNLSLVSSDQLIIEVEDQVGVPIAGVKASVATSDDPDVIVAEASTDVNGRIQLSLTPDTCYQILLEAPEGSLFSATSSTARRSACLDSMEPAVVRATTIPVATTAPVTFRAASNLGQPLEGIPAVVSDSAPDSTEPPVASGSTGADGQVVFDLAPGCYRLEATHPEGWEVRAFPSTNPFSETFCVSDDSPSFVDAEFVDPDSRGSIAWEVLSPDSQPLAGFGLTVTSDDTGEVVATTTSGDPARSTIRDLRLGCYSLALEATDGWVFTDGEVTRDSQVCIKVESLDVRISYDVVAANEPSLIEVSVQTPNFDLVPGLVVEAYGVGDQEGELLAAVTTTDNSLNAFLEVDARCFELRFLPPAGWELDDGQSSTDRGCTTLTRTTYTSLVRLRLSDDLGGAVPFAVGALGTTGSEQLGLEVNGEVVESWQLGTELALHNGQIPLDAFAGGDPAASGNTVRVVFLNDGQEPVAGNRDVFVDEITLGDSRYNPRALKSKGSWVNGSGCGEGFVDSNWLHCRGWFEVIAPVDTAPTVGYTVRGSGTTGSELVGVEVNGELQATVALGLTSRDFSGVVPRSAFVGDGPEAPGNTVRLVFLNDGQEPIAGNRDVFVEEITLDGISYDPLNLKSKGSWVSGSGCGEGFVNSNWLHCRGWFEVIAP